MKHLKRKLMMTLVALLALTTQAWATTVTWNSSDFNRDGAFTKDDVTVNFCVEFYLCNNDTEVYKAVEALQVGDVVDIEGFLYWYNGANVHLTAVTKAAE